jgi:hypothetical protein
MALTALLATGCSSGTDEPGIAQLDNTDTATSTAEAGSESSEEQALAFAQCMRDNGVDFPDPTVDADGNPSFEGAFGRSEEGGFDPEDTSFQDAIAACSDLMEGMVMGPGGGDFDSGAINEALYAYTQCLRDEGLDVGDITLSGMMGGMGGPSGADEPADAGEAPALADGEQPEGPPEGVRGGGGDPSDRFAEQLGQDADDPAWIAANEVCQPVLEDAISSAGMPGGQG